MLNKYEVEKQQDAEFAINKGNYLEAKGIVAKFVIPNRKEIT
jgi:hypothetical protein